MSISKEKFIKDVVPEMMKEFQYQVPIAVPKIEKIVVNIGTGKVRDKKDTVENIVNHLTLITGQRPYPRAAKKAISTFKMRQGEVIGYKTTLRGKRMYDFLDRLVNLAIPRMRDFHGISLKSIDEGGNLTLGIREHIVFPEIIGENIRDIFGFEITIVTNAKSRDEAIKLFRLLGFPLQKT